jgi:hypothetical protein
MKLISTDSILFDAFDAMFEIVDLRRSIGKYELYVFKEKHEFNIYRHESLGRLRVLKNIISAYMLVDGPQCLDLQLYIDQIEDIYSIQELQSVSGAKKWLGL